jgi:hypothetical protein
VCRPSQTLTKKPCLCPSLVSVLNIITPLRKHPDMGILIGAYTMKFIVRDTSILFITVRAPPLTDIFHNVSDKETLCLKDIF